MNRNSKVRDTVFEEERQELTVPFMLNRYDVPIQSEYVIILEEPVVDQLTTPIMEIHLRRSQRIRSQQHYVYLLQSDFNIGKSKNPNSFDEAVFCSDSDRWFTAMQEELKFMHDNHCGIL